MSTTPTPGSPPPASDPPSSLPPAQQLFSWKDHPLVIATLAVSATLVVGGGIVKDFIIPAYTETLKNQLVDLPRLQKENLNLHQKVGALENQLLISRSETASALTANLFVHGDPFPVDLTSVRLGDPISKIDSTFKPSSIEKLKRASYWSVKTDHPIFHDVTYYFDRSSSNPTVNRIFIFPRSKEYAGVYLERKLISTLGSPSGKDEDGRIYWQRKGDWVIFDDIGYLISLSPPVIAK